MSDTKHICRVYIYNHYHKKTIFILIIFYILICQIFVCYDLELHSQFQDIDLLIAGRTG